MTINDKPTRLVSCPRCRKSARYDVNNPFRPFCSALCKDEDIIAWAEMNYKIPGKPAAGADEGDDELEDREDEA